MAQTNPARRFVAEMKPQMEAIRNVRSLLHERRSDFSALHGVQLLAEQVDLLAVALQELLDATADALDKQTS